MTIRIDSRQEAARKKEIFAKNIFIARPKYVNYEHKDFYLFIIQWVNDTTNRCCHTIKSVNEPTTTGPRPSGSNNTRNRERNHDEKAIKHNYENGPHDDEFEFHKSYECTVKLLA